MEDDAIVFEGDKYNVFFRGELKKTVEGAISLEDVKAVALSEGIKKAIVKDRDGKILHTGDFPYKGDVYIEPYHEAGL